MPADLRPVRAAKVLDANRDAISLGAVEAAIFVAK